MYVTLYDLELTLFEEKLGLARKFARVKACADEIEATLGQSDIDENTRRCIVSLTEEIKNNT